MRFIISLVMLISSLLALRSNDLDSNIQNGKTLLLEFEKKESVKYQNIIFDDKEFKIFDAPLDKKKVYVLIPISYYQKPEQKTAVLNYVDNSVQKHENIIVNVQDGNYTKEEIHVDSSKVNPQDKEVQKRVSKEYQEAIDIYNSVSAKSYINSQFIMPIESEITSSFGKARTYNGSLKGYHSGTDFRAKVPTPIVAVNDGKVVLVKDRFYSGGTIILDHGEGIYTCYFHMSKFDVKEQQLIKKGQTLGLSGQSGRVTGPHLHFSARISGIQVDPLQLISLMNDKLLKGNE